MRHLKGMAASPARTHLGVRLEVAGLEKDFSTVRNGTAWVPFPGHDWYMLHKKVKKDLGDTTRESVKKEMATPRIARSARIAELKLDTVRIPEQPSTTISGTVDKIIPSPQPSQPEQANITVDAPNKRYRDLRIENKLTDEHGDDVSLKKGAHVDVAFTSK